MGRGWISASAVAYITIHWRREVVLAVIRRHPCAMIGAGARRREGHDARSRRHQVNDDHEHQEDPQQATFTSHHDPERVPPQLTHTLGDALGCFRSMIHDNLMNVVR